MLPHIFLSREWGSRLKVLGGEQAPGEEEEEAGEEETIFFPLTVGAWGIPSWGAEPSWMPVKF